MVLTTKVPGTSLCCAEYIPLCEREVELNYKFRRPLASGHPVPRDMAVQHGRRIISLRQLIIFRLKSNQLGHTDARRWVEILEPVEEGIRRATT